MPGLQDSKWAPKGPGKGDDENNKKKPEPKRYTRMSDFGFTLPKIAAKKSNVAASVPVPVLVITPANDYVSITAPVPASVTETELPAQHAENFSTKSDKGSKKPLSRAEIAAAATRARLAEINGPGRD